MVFLTTLVALVATCHSLTSANSLPSKRSEGYYEIKNNCNSRIWYNKVGQEGTIIEDGYVEKHTATYGSYGADGDGISVKLAWHKNSPTPYQFETTVKSDTHQVFYDLSAVNGDPFKDVENGVWTSDNSGPLVWCPAGSSDCAYQYSKDDTKTHAASLGAVLTMQVC